MCRERLQDTQVKGPCPQAVYLALFQLAVTCTNKLKKNRPTMVLVSGNRFKCKLVIDIFNLLLLMSLLLALASKLPIIMLLE